ncbi:hypothetical protein CFOL_v3_12180 [Cephalotus follicularis]|uniref:Uncharacterized protein n=1 Tax=Cephalotus follicularis TaxID=3775 RepID=A0A1Q3BKY2_CEPFO|nr:hypothetical protein CFOL_v3_12180 [Cephalotus follicularis]
MESVTSTSSASAFQVASSQDEIFMQQRLEFSDTLKDLKNLRKQLYSAAEYFEVSYGEENQKQIVMETLKDYTAKALINTIDHLGSVAYKVNSLLDENIGGVYRTELRLCCMEQRLQTCKEFINCGGLCQQLMEIQNARHHKQYICSVGETLDAFGQIEAKYHPSRLSAEDNLHQFKNAVRVTTRETSSPYVREGHSTLNSPQFSLRQGNFSITRTTSINQKRVSDKQATSPHRSPLMRSGSVFFNSSTPNYSGELRPYPIETRRSVSMPSNAERDRTKDFQQQSSKSKRLLKALISMGKPQKGWLI